MGFSFILLTVNPFRHPTLIEHGLYKFVACSFIIEIFTSTQFQQEHSILLWKTVF